MIKLRDLLKEGTFNSSKHIATFERNDGMYVDVYKVPGGYYAQTPKFDFDAKSKKEMEAELKYYRFTTLVAGELI